MTSSWDTSLEPLRTALTAAAQADADQARADAESEGAQAVAAAEREAAELLAAARSQGAADAADLVAVEQSRSRRASHNVVLTAQRAAYDELRRQAGTAVRRLLADSAQRTRLQQLAADRLRAEVVIRGVPDGGVVAEAADGRRIDVSVHALVDDVVASLDLEALWTP